MILRPFLFEPTSCGALTEAKIDPLAAALVRGLPPGPAGEAAIVAANRSGRGRVAV